MEITAKETNKEGHIVIVSSSAHFWALKEGITFDKLNEKTRHVHHVRYAQSKLASILYVKELSRHLQEKGSNVMANALHPGAIRTKLVNESMGLFMRYLLFILLGPFWKTIPQVQFPHLSCHLKNFICFANFLPYFSCHLFHYLVVFI
jgi:NAD(P)-dependent dehydrogenase (short-subunit alcohol dehydrogenase family)